MNRITSPATRIWHLAAALTTTLLASSLAHATPYASSITNDGSGNMSFYLNEGGATVWITYEDTSTNANFNGLTTGTNLAAGAYVFALGAHTSYSINCYKLGAGVPTLIAQSPAFTPRGVDVNKRAASPYFGRVYASSVSTTPGRGIYAFNPDMTSTFGAVRAAGVTWFAAVYSPYRLSVAEDDYVMVGDASWTGGATGSAQNDGVWRLDPNLTSNQLFLGPKGKDAGQAAGVHQTIMSRPVVLGNVQAGGPVTLLQVDGDFPPANSLLVYSNITLAGLPYQTAPDIIGPAIGINLASTTLGGNSYPGLQFVNGYIYAGTYRENYSNPLLQIYEFSGGTINPVWNSKYASNGDYLRRTNGVTIGATIDIATSPDSRYVAGVSINNYFIVIPLTNGIPDVANLFMNTPTAYTGNGRALAFDAADNLYVSSSGLGLVQSWSLGLTTTATTTGNGTGSTGFSVIFPSTTVNVVATSNFASQGGVNGVPGTPIPGTFTITRTNASSDYSAPISVNFTLAGTATNGVYTTFPSVGITPAGSGTVVIGAGQTSTNISIIPSTNNVPRLQTTVVLSLAGGAAYGVSQPSSDTVYIQNTSTNQLVLTAGAPTMYKAFSNDFASVTITRLGDTNVAVTTAPYTYSGTAVAGTDFTPMPAATFNLGDITKTPKLSPLSNGVPPVDVIDPLYVGNKTVTVGLPAGSDYLISGANSTALTLLDNAYPPSGVLFVNPLTSSDDATNWNITFGSGDQVNHPADYTVQFGYDLTANNPESGVNGLIGLPPSGATNALRITCNKNLSSGEMFAGGVNVYYTNQVFSSNYAVRFNMNLVEGDNSFSVEGVSFGINHNGSQTNWWLGGGTLELGSGPWASDGVWYWIQAPPGGAGGFGFSEFQEYTGAGGQLPNAGWTQLATATATTFRNTFKHAVFTAPGGGSGGTPANNSPVSANPADNNWSDVEIKQINNVITLAINKTTIFNYTNTTKFTNGYIMLGYNCPIQGAFHQYVGTPDASAYFSNLRVVSLTKPQIISINDVPSGGNHNVTIVFRSTDGDDTAASFALQGASLVTGAYADVTATITQLPQVDGTAVFQATATSANAVQFYRIRHK
jgi:hypothetical protein